MIPAMVTLSTAMLIVLLIAGGITVVAMLSVFANVIEHETQLHDLRNRVRELHFNHAMYMARFRGQIGDEPEEEGEIEILDDGPQAALEQTEALAAELREEVEAAKARAA